MLFRPGPQHAGLFLFSGTGVAASIFCAKLGGKFIPRPTDAIPLLLRGRLDKSDI